MPPFAGFAHEDLSGGPIYTGTPTPPCQSNLPLKPISQIPKRFGFSCPCLDLPLHPSFTFPSTDPPTSSLSDSFVFVPYSFIIEEEHSLHYFLLFNIHTNLSRITTDKSQSDYFYTALLFHTILQSFATPLPL
jgi:hypothetical protein